MMAQDVTSAGLSGMLHSSNVGLESFGADQEMSCISIGHIGGSEDDMAMYIGEDDDIDILA
jgi:hypothetical protein